MSLHLLFFCCFRKYSRQEYLKKREEKKLEELRYDSTSIYFLRVPVLIFCDEQINIWYLGHRCWVRLFWL
jgi:hypothetical protein